MFLIVLSYIFMSQAISLMDLFGMRQTQALTALLIVSYRLVAHIHVTGHFSHGSLWIAPDSGSDSINDLWRLSENRGLPLRKRSSVLSSTSKTIFSTFEFSKPRDNVVNSRSCSFKKLHYFRVCLARAMELNNGGTFSTHIWC